MKNVKRVWKLKWIIYLSELLLLLLLLLTGYFMPGTKLLLSKASGVGPFTGIVFSLKTLF